MSHLAKAQRYNLDQAGRLWQSAAELPPPLDTLDPSSVEFAQRVIAFQRANNLAPDGMLGPATRKAMRAAMPPPPTPDVLGIDVSAWQPRIDWGQVASSGYRFAWIKATQDVRYTSPIFKQQARAALAAGLAVGAYHYAMPSAGDSPEREAEHMVAACRDLGLTLLPALDYEEMRPSKAAPPFLASFLVQWAERFVTRVHAVTGSWPVFYGYTAMLRHMAPAVATTSPLLSCPLWQSQVGDGGKARTEPPTRVAPFPVATVHQFSWRGKVPGIGRADGTRQPVDLNRTTAAGLARLMGGA